MSKQHMSLCFYVFGNAPIGVPDPRQNIQPTSRRNIIVMPQRRLERRPKQPPTNLRGIFAGCGTLLNRTDMVPHVLGLTGKSNPHDVTLVYLGTPSYDLPEKRIAQTSHYVELGCTVLSLDVVTVAPPTSRMREIIDVADVILVSGGNTHFAMGRWSRLGLDSMMREACLGPRRVVMAGGSAGAIW